MTTQWLSCSLQLIDVRAEIARLLREFPCDLLATSRQDSAPEGFAETTSLLAVEAEISNGALVVQRAALVPCTPENRSTLRTLSREFLSEAVAESGHPTPARRREFEEKPTVRELKVLALVREGRRNREIAEILHISEDTVKTRMKNAMAKLSATNRTHAVTIASARGWLDAHVASDRRALMAG